MLARRVLRVQQNSVEGPVMTDAERALALKATTQMQLGNGMFINDREFKAQFCKENGITDDYLTDLVRQLLDGK